LNKKDFAMRIAAEFVQKVNSISAWSGKAVAWLILPLVLELVYDTVSRYLFNAPTVWSYDLSYMLSGALFMIGGAYTLLSERHIRIEIFYTNFSPRGKAIADVIGYLVFFFPCVGALVYFGVEYAAESWLSQEKSLSSYWSPPVYHFKSLIPLAASLLLLQGLAKFIEAWSVILHKELDVGH
jgi:TRAP-type mannitol/chloroaromatic compound transport system permease small subunit